MLRSFFLLSFLFSSFLYADTYELDKAHSRIEFRIKHMVISTVTGNFKDFSGGGEFDPKTMQVKNAKLEVKVDSINTNEPDRDKHLRSAAFFDAQKYPTINFEITKVNYQGEGTDKEPKTIEGNLTIRGTTKPISLTVKSSGAGLDPWGNESLGFDATATIDRRDFGLTWNKQAQNPIKKAAIWMVSNDVDLDIGIRAKKVVEKKVKSEGDKK